MSRPGVFASQPPALHKSEEATEDLSKAIVFYRREERCRPHNFSSSPLQDDFLGRGAYGEVFKVECISCHGQYAKKIIRFMGNTSRAHREKHIQDTDMELKCYMTLDHPNILAYIHHELDSMKMQIYTEFCQLKDLEHFLGDQLSLPDVFPWHILEGLASALARCHYGLRVTRESGLVCHYTRFEKEWQPILHRDIKPGNVLVAVKDKMMIPKLGDFGTSFKLEEDGKPPSTRAGTRAYWAPEIKEADGNLEGRITKWSKESDIWGVGAVLYTILTCQRPTGKQPDSLNERIKQLQESTPEGRAAVPQFLAHVISECLNPSVDGRPSALQLLAVVMKSDTSSQGLERSESFWRVMAMHADSELASSVVTHFVSKHLSILKGKTIFGLLETTLIMSLAYKHCPRLITLCHNVLCGSLLKDEEREITGSTAFHVIAWLPSKNEEIVRFAFEDSMWPFARELSHLALRTNKEGLLPSAIAALRGKKDLCVCLAKIEERARDEIRNTGLKSERDSLRESLQAHAAREFEFMFSLLTQNVAEFSMSSSEASKAMIGVARGGFSNMARKLVELGIDPSSPSIRGSHSETVLHHFAHLGDASMVRFLLEANVNVDARDKSGRTPLHWAAWSGQDGAVNALLSGGADVNATDAGSRTALYGAVGGGFTDAVSQLLSCNANITIRGGKNNETPLERAKKNNHIPVIDLLSRNMSR